jgi:hypothetical protein
VRRATIALCVGLALAAAGCGSRAASSPVVPLGGWSPVASACDAGASDCVPLVAAEMLRRYQPLAASCSHDAAFALMYLRVTQTVGRAEPTFAARAYLAHLDSVFAGLYFQAYDRWRSGHRAQVPLAWQIAFEASEGGRVSGIGDLLLGMNAHISRDLPFAVATIGSGGAAGRRSFEQVNRVLERVARPILREEARRFDPTIAGFSLPVISASAATLGELLVAWRDGALHDAQRLMRANSAGARAAVAGSIERTAAARAALIATATSRVAFSRAGKARDGFCRSHAQR